MAVAKRRYHSPSPLAGEGKRRGVAFLSSLMHFLYRFDPFPVPG
jgi:hypothetical protein